MFAHLSERERVIYAGGSLALLGFLGYLGASHLQPAASVTITSTPSPVAAPLRSSEPSAPPISPPTKRLVHMAGAVVRPGLYEFRTDERVADGIRKAGGAKPNADLDQINLAAKLADGDQVFIPAKRPTAPEPVVAPTYQGGSVKPMGLAPARPAPSKPGGLVVPKASPRGPFSLNTASRAQLESLPGVGPATAASILEYRQAHGGFGSVDELLAIRGIGEKKLAKMKPFLKL